MISRTNPSRNGKIVDANEVFLELQKFLEVLHLNESAVKLHNHLRDISKRSWKRQKSHSSASEGSLRRLQYESSRSRTSRVSEVVVCRWIVFAEALQDLFIVHEAVQRPQEEDVERQVTDLLKLKVSAQTLQLSGRATRPLQLQQRLRMLLQMSRQQLRSQREWTIRHGNNTTVLQSRDINVK